MKREIAGAEMSGRPAVKLLRRERPRLYHPAGDPGFTFAPPTDPGRKLILANILASCEELAGQEPAAEIPLCPDSPHPFHQLYISFYMGMEASALIEQYSFAWRVTGDSRWRERAGRWINAAVNWEHSDRVEEHFYTANRYMQALAVALDWLAGALTEAEEQRIEGCLARLLERWWPEVNAQRHNPEAGHHPVVDNGHFGVAALQLLGRHQQAEDWVSAVVDRFRGAIMINGCGQDGSPCDGLGFWGPENAWMLQFCDALRNVTGLDLYREFPERLIRPLLFIRYHLAAPEEISPLRYASAYANILTVDATKQLDGCSAVLLRLAQEAADKEMRDIALRDARMGCIHHYGAGVKSSNAECLIAMGPYAYLWYDPKFQPRPAPAKLPLSRRFGGRCSDTVIQRSSWDTRSLVVQVTGYRGGGAPHEFSNLHLQWAGWPVLTGIGAFEASPVACGNLVAVGGQNEHVARVCENADRQQEGMTAMESPRSWHQYWFLKGPVPALLVAVRRRPRGVKLIRSTGNSYVRLDGHDYLQYPREPYFNPDAGVLHLRLRLSAPVDRARRQIFFHTGTSLPSSQLHPGGTNVNTFFLGLMGDGKGLTFGVRSQRFLLVTVEIPVETASLKPDFWHDITIRWGGFNEADGAPFIELELDGHRRRVDDPDGFGEVGRNSHGLTRQQALAFRIRPNTVMAFGAAVQLPDSGFTGDIAGIDLRCAQRQWLYVDFSQGLAGETGSGELVYKLNPVRLLSHEQNQVLLAAGPEQIAVHSLLPGTEFRIEKVPFYASGLAASSRKSFRPDKETDATRLSVAAQGRDRLVFLFVPAAAQWGWRKLENGFELCLEGHRYTFNSDFPVFSGGVVD